LGLCLVKTFVELHGGRVEVQSTPGRGSSFGFLLPRRQPLAVKAKTASKLIETASADASLAIT